MKGWVLIGNIGMFRDIGRKLEEYGVIEVKENDYNG